MTARPLRGPCWSASTNRPKDTERIGRKLMPNLGLTFRSRPVMKAGSRLAENEADHCNPGFIAGDSADYSLSVGADPASALARAEVPYTSSFPRPLDGG